MKDDMDDPGLHRVMYPESSGPHVPQGTGPHELLMTSTQLMRSVPGFSDALRRFLEGYGWVWKQEEGQLDAGRCGSDRWTRTLQASRSELEGLYGETCLIPSGKRLPFHSLEDAMALGFELVMVPPTCRIANVGPVRVPEKYRVQNARARASLLLIETRNRPSLEGRDMDLLSGRADLSFPRVVNTVADVRGAIVSIADRLGLGEQQPRLPTQWEYKLLVDLFLDRYGMRSHLGPLCDGYPELVNVGTSRPVSFLVSFGVKRRLAVAANTFPAGLRLVIDLS
jgi:hypothetical protein